MIAYTIELTVEEECDLRMMSERGYDCGLWNKLRVVHIINDNTTRYAVGHSEGDLWACFDAYNEELDNGNDPWGPFVAETLRPKLDALMQEVV